MIVIGSIVACAAKAAAVLPPALQPSFWNVYSIDGLIKESQVAVAPSGACI